MTIDAYINEGWNGCRCFQQQDEGTLIGMPYPYIVPTVNPQFREMYYWDTYFTNKGLILSGHADWAKNNVDNMLYLVNRFGYMLNGNRTFYIPNSQPPFLSMMVRDVYHEFPDPVWLASAVRLLEREYEFWITRRITKIGLSQYSGEYTSDAECARLHQSGIDRVGAFYDQMDDRRGFYCVCGDGESGWDCTPRLAGHQPESVWVDLNSNLHQYELNFAEFAEILGKDGSAWREKARKRRELMRRYLWNGTAFVDYDFERQEHSSVFSAASFYPLAYGVSTPEEAAKTLTQLPRVEYDHGITACAPNDVPGRYQWNYPNGWPPLQYMVVMGLDRAGFTEDAHRVAEKYVRMVEQVFDKTQHLWEKYNVVNGTTETVDEYDKPAMMGWSAGVYLALREYIKK